LARGGQAHPLAKGAVFSKLKTGLPMALASLRSAVLVSGAAKKDNG